MTRAREQIISLEDTPYYHCMARCVRRAYLFGSDSVTGASYDHRKAWVVDKLASLNKVFAIDVCAYAVMSNHYHVVLRVNQEQAEQWSLAEVIDRWCSLFAGNVLVNRYRNGDAKSKAELEKVTEIVEQWRARLIDISWFMRILNESIARMANEEDGCKGRFWEGRFKSQALLDEAAVLACMAYVDLNPVRAGIADLPEESDFTSIQQRLALLAERGVGRPSKAGTREEPKRVEINRRITKQAKDTNAEPNTKSSTKPSTELKREQPILYPFNKGFALKDGEEALPFSVADYLELIDWTGRAIRADKAGAIPEQAPPILSRLGLTPSGWLKYVPEVEKRFTHAVGNRDSLKQLAARFKRSWLRGQGASIRIYQPVGNH